MVFPPICVLSMRMQVILDSSFARPGSAPIWGGKKGEFRDWTKSWRKRTIYITSDPENFAGLGGILLETIIFI